VTLDRFPRRTLRGDRTIYRIHRSAGRAWWFSSDGSGRFDPIGTGSAACYLAERPLDGWIEVFRKQMLLSQADISGRALFSVDLGRDLRLADITSRRALEFGLTASLGANQCYRDSHAFAVRAIAAGFDGIRYLVRHDPAQRLYGLALFGAPGAPDPADPNWPEGVDGDIPLELITEAERAFGYRVLPPP
jgi:RES domain-containing protein